MPENNERFNNLSELLRAATYHVPRFATEILLNLRTFGVFADTSQTAADVDTNIIIRLWLSGRLPSTTVSGVRCGLLFNRTRANNGGRIGRRTCVSGTGRGWCLGCLLGFGSRSIGLHRHCFRSYWLG